MDYLDVAREILKEEDATPPDPLEIVTTLRDIGEVEVKPWPEPMTDEAFYGLAGEVISAIEPYSEADRHALLITFLTMFGNLIHRGACYPVAADKHFTNLFVVIVGDSAKGRKGMSANLIIQLLSKIDEPWARRITSGLSSGEGLIYAVRDPVYARQPIKERGRTVDYEEVMTDGGVSDKRLIVLEAEFAQALRVMGRQGNTLSPVIRQAWDKGTLNTLIKNNQNRATDAHISIIGHITLYELLELMQNNESYNGFANRFLWVLSKRGNLLPDGAVVPETLQNQLTTKIQKAVAFAGLHNLFQESEHQETTELGRVPLTTGIMNRDPEARKYWWKLYRELSDEKLGLYGAIVARAEAQVLRLSMIYALLDKSYVIRREHIQAAYAVWDYSDRCAEYIFAGKVRNSNAEEIIIALKAAGGELTQTQISNDIFNRNVPAVVIKNALEELLEDGRVERVKEDTGGRPKIIWKLTEGGTK